MIDKEQLKKMIKTQEETIKNLTIQLNELKKVARENGILDEVSVVSDFGNRSKTFSEVEKKRQEIFDSIQNVREEAQAAAKKAMDEAKNNMMASSNLMNNFPSEHMRPNLQNIPSSFQESPIDIFKERNLKKTDEESNEKLKKMMEELQEKNKNKFNVKPSLTEDAPKVSEVTPEVVEEKSEVVEEK